MSFMFHNNTNNIYTNNNQSIDNPLIHFIGFDIISKWPAFMGAAVFYLVLYIVEMIVIMIMTFKAYNPRYTGGLVLNTITSIFLLLLYISTVFNEGWSISYENKPITWLRWYIYPIVLFIRLYQLLFVTRSHKYRKQKLSLIFAFSFFIIFSNVQYIRTEYVRYIWIGIGYSVQLAGYIILFKQDFNIVRFICTCFFVIYCHIYEVMLLLGTENIAIIELYYENIVFIILDVIGSISAILFIIIMKVYENIEYRREKEEDSNRIYSSSSRMDMYSATDSESTTPLGSLRRLSRHVSWYDDENIP